jgi:hypothetical protein
MPKTTYALFESIRSHRITRPVADPDPKAPLNACNLCHQDRSLGWTERWIEQWYGRRAPTPVEPNPPGAAGSAPEHSAAPTDTSEASDAGPRPMAARATTWGDPAAWSALAVAALSGDAAARVIAIAALGDTSARAASTTGWQPRVLAEALDDPYAAVRFVAARSLRSFSGFEDLELRFDAPRPERLLQQQAARQRAMLHPNSVAPGALPVDAAGRLQPGVLEALVERRDPSPVRISE